MAFNNTIVARVAAAVWGLKLGYTTTQAALTQANFEAGGLTSVINAAFNDSYGSVSNASIASTVVSNLGLTGTAATDGEAYIVAQLAGVATTARGNTLAQIVSLFSGLSADPVYGAAATAFNAKVAAATAYASVPANTADVALGFLPSASSFFLTLGQDNMTGTAGNDEFTAYIFDNANSLQSADRLNGGAGDDTLFADMGSSQNFSVTPITSNIEKIVIRAQSEATVQGSNNVAGSARVQVDAERIAGELQYESNNSRSDVIVEDVRIADNQITSDITIAFVESDPGHVDFGVYFDQYSLRNQSSATSSINLRIMDTVAAAAGKAPLLNSNYGAFTFTVTQPGGAPTVVTLGSKAIQDAQTYAEMAAAFQAQLDVTFGAGAATATVGENFTVTDPDSRQAVTGQTIVLTTKTATAFTTPAGSGWLADGTAPPASNFYTNFTTGQTKSTSLVTSKVILDDVGRGSTGGDLLIGGLSTGISSSSLGVQRFEIEVRDNSKLQSISSTNNTLREVTLVNGVTSSQSHAYVDTVKDAGNITVNGNAGVNGQNVSGFSGRTAVGTTVAGLDAQLPGTSQTNNFGFTDVRLIDASTMRGKVEYTADITARSLQKYLNTRDIQAVPAGDNVAFSYSGGVNDDTLWIRIDTDAASSRSTIMAGREDFTFTVTGGNGNDWLNVGLNTPPGGLQAWYNNQKLNKNVTVDGGAGDDIIRTPGAGDKIILAGTGNDVVYADNTGNQAANGQTSSRAGAAYAAAEAAELAAVLAAATLSNDTNSAGTGTLSNPLRQPDATVAALDTLNLVTPVTHNDPAVPAAPNPLLPTRAALIAAIDAAFAAGALTVQQQQALIAPAGYNLRTGDTITVPTTEVRPALVPGAAVAGALTAAEFAAGNALLDGYITAAKAAAATAQAADDVLASQTALLNATQQAVVTATIAVNGIASVQAGSVNGTAVNLANLNALKGALIVGATDAQLVAALTTAVDNGAITGPLGAGQSNALFTAATSAGAGVMDAAELFAVQVILEPLVAAATTANTTANTTLTNAINANNTAVRTASNIVGADPVLATASAVAGDSVGSTEAAAAQAAAEAALTAFNTATLTPATTLQTQLSALKSALSVGVSDLNFSLITAGVSAAVNTAFGGSAAAVLNPLTFAGPPLIAGTVSATEKETIDRAIQAVQETNNLDVATAQARAATLTANVTATTFAAAQALAAANASPNSGFAADAYARAVWVLNTSNQLNPSNTAYVLNVNDERNVSDLRSDVDNTHNMFATRLTVTFKDLTSTVTVPHTGYRTSDLQINQAIKEAINNDAVLKTLLDATDGPANTLVITSRIDGVMSNANLAIAVTLPAVGSLPLGDVNLAATAYGVAQTEAAVLAAMATALTSFNTKGDYVDQIGETGAFGGNAAITGANSTTTADNTITPGDGNDVIVLGTTVDTTTPGNALLSSNDTVVYGANFGNDTIVHFRAGSLASGGDILNLSAVGGNVLTSAFNVNRSVTVANEVTLTNNTPALVAGLFVDSATAQTHVYVAVDTATNIGKVYTVTDTAGVASGSVTAVLAGTIDLADTLWSTLTAENFG